MSEQIRAADLFERSRDRLLQQQRALAALTRSEIFSGEDVQQAIRLLTQTSANELEVERVSVWRFADDRSAIECVDLYELSCQRHSTGSRLLVEDFPRYFEGLAEEEAIVADDARSHPCTSEFSEIYLKPFGITSMLDVPIHVFGRLEGVLCHEQVGSPIAWSAEQRFFAIAVANLAALVIEQSERKRAEALVRDQKDVLEMIANRASLAEILAKLAKMIEQQDDRMICSILLLDADRVHLRHGAAPSLPDEYNRQVDGIAIGPEVGSCGTAAFTGQTVIVTEIRTDPRCAVYRDLAERHGLRACWSTPILDSAQRVMGTFAIYYREPRGPSDTHLRLLEMASHMAAIAIERSQTEHRIQHLAFYDPLTELPNRTLFHDRAAQILALAARDKTEMAVLFMDLDRFKTINDSLGHHVGDRLLRAVAGRLTECLRESDSVSRLGGDEFVMVLPESGAQAAAHVAERILGAALRPYVIDDYRLSITPSIGISIYPQDGQDIDTLIKNADNAMYRAKERGRNTFQFFTSDMNAAVLERLTIENGLRQALERGEFLLHYQPQFEIATRKLIGVEALIRWKHPELGMMPPGRFISVAEETGLIIPIGEWVLREACRQSHHWQSLGMPKIPVAVNISAPQFRQRIEEIVQRVLAETGLDANYLELELTEGMVMHEEETILVRLHRLRDMGVKLSIDDFGTGYSSLSYLKRFPISKLKIDQSFVRDIIVDQDDLAIARAVISMGHSLRLTVMAEGVETEEQLIVLREEGCDHAQGYYFNRSLPADELERLLRRELDRVGTGHAHAEAERLARISHQRS